MNTKPVFSVENTHGILQRFNADFAATSEGLGWSSAFASLQRERPFEGRFRALSDCLMVLHRGGPVDVTFRMEGKTIPKHIPKGGIFFLPADHECDVELHSDLDTLHMYLRADLFAASRGETRCRATRLEPIFGQPDAVLEHLGEAIGEVIRNGPGESSLFVDPLVNAIAKRFIALNFRDQPHAEARPASRLSGRQVRNLREFVELELHRDIRLDNMAAVCGLNTEYFTRLFMGSRPAATTMRRRAASACEPIAYGTGCG